MCTLPNDFNSRVCSNIMRSNFFSAGGSPLCDKRKEKICWWMLDMKGDLFDHDLRPEAWTSPSNGWESDCGHV